MVFKIPKKNFTKRIITIIFNNFKIIFLKGIFEKYVKLVFESSLKQNYKQSKENGETFLIYLPRKAVSELLHSLHIMKQRNAVKK